MNNRKTYGRFLLGHLMLWLFVALIFPLNLLHHHQPLPSNNERHCTHAYHLKAQKEDCVICSHHFEKNFLPAVAHLHFLNEPSFAFASKEIVVSDYTSLISQSLRGPPSLV